MDDSLLRLIYKQKEYITLLTQELGNIFMIANIHGYETPKELIDEGERLRKEISDLFIAADLPNE